MIKTSLAALVAIAAISVVPAFAAPHPVVEEQPSNNPYYSETDVLDRLQQRGFNAVAVENWGMLIRAYVRQDDGTEAQMFFKRDSLVPVAL